MRKPNHIILDFESSKQLNSANYWALNFFKNQPLPIFLDNTYVFRKHNLIRPRNQTIKLLNDYNKFTLKPSQVNEAEFLKPWEKEGLNNIYKPTKSVQDINTLNYFLNYSQSKGRNWYMYLNLSDTQYIRRGVKYLFNKYKKSNTINISTNLNTTNNLININFLRKERLYTKLKYSRSPAFDIVSGGAAALLAGFIGFLISEKFGYELVDSGDFYYLFMYGVFGAFLLKPLMYTLNVSESFLSTLSYRNILKFFTKILLLFFKTLKLWVRV